MQYDAHSHKRSQHKMLKRPNSIGQILVSAAVQEGTVPAVLRCCAQSAGVMFV